jgi:hypothetical protein
MKTRDIQEMSLRLLGAFAVFVAALIAVFIALAKMVPVLQYALDLPYEDARDIVVNIFFFIMIWVIPPVLVLVWLWKRHPKAFGLLIAVAIGIVFNWHLVKRVWGWL